MLKYDYIMKTKNNGIFNIISDNVEIENFLNKINGVYKKLVWLVQINKETKEKKEYLIHNDNGFIYEYGLFYINGKRVI